METLKELWRTLLLNLRVRREERRQPEEGGDLVTRLARILK